MFVFVITALLCWNSDVLVSQISQFSRAHSITHLRSSISIFRTKYWSKYFATKLAPKLWIWIMFAVEAFVKIGHVSDMCCKICSTTTFSFIASLSLVLKPSRKMFGWWCESPFPDINISKDRVTKIWPSKILCALLLYILFSLLLRFNLAPAAN